MTSGGTTNTNPGTAINTASSIPVWVSGQQVWVRGVDKKTTVSDIVVAFVGKNDQLSYNIVEKWRKSQKPLDQSTKIFKLWNSWGTSAQNEVKLTLEKKSNVDDDSGRGSPSSTTTNTTATTATSCRRRHRSHQNKHKHHKHNSQTLHPKRLEQLSKEHNVEKESIEQLLKLILVQGETIQSQLQKLQDRNKKIEMLEELQHKNMVNMLGTDYVLNTYLSQSATASSDSCQVAEPCDNTKVSGASCKRTKDKRRDVKKCIEEEDEEEDGKTLEEQVEAEIKELKKKIDLFENITKLNDRIELEEEKLIQLNHAIKNHENSEQIDMIVTKIEALSVNNRTSMEQVVSNDTALENAEDMLINKKKYLSFLETQFQNECLLEGEFMHNLEVVNNNILSNTYSSLTHFSNVHFPPDEKSGTLSLKCPPPTSYKGALDTLV